MLTSSQIRQSFLDFFREKQHTIVPSGSLMPDSPNLLFTNAGMNQFVPIFLGEKKADVSKWANAIPSSDTRAADTQKCIRAGGKHNDLDDVGLDTYHHTFFEMLGNWSFGDYFKKEAIEWAWELIVGRWKFPPQRLYATIYHPDKSQGDPAERDGEAWNFWAEKFRSVGVDPAAHIVNGNKKDNFWMMGETGPCGPCSELHVDLTPAGDTKGALVNKGTAECIEIWNLVFIQFNANPDGTFTPLPARHVDTGMGFERVTSIIQGTKGFTDFANAKISNYETDIFRPIFDELEKMSGHRYGGTLPVAQASSLWGQRASSPQDGGQDARDPHSQDGCATNQIALDVAFRVIADHIRTLSFAIADGIQPGNNDRNYVLRRILRRAVRYGRTLGFHEPFFHKLVDVLARTMGDVFPEIRAKQKHIEETLKREEESFNKTLDKGIALFEEEAARITGGTIDAGRAGLQPAVPGFEPGTSNVASRASENEVRPAPEALGSKPALPRDAQDPHPLEGTRYTKRRRLPHFEKPWAIYFVTLTTRNHSVLSPASRTIVLDTLRHFHRQRYELFAACVMPDHVHLLIQPWPKEKDDRGETTFWPLGEIMHSVKRFSAREINKADGTEGAFWEEERFDRFVRGDSDLEEKFLYICNNPRGENLVGPDKEYEWVWTPDYQTEVRPTPDAPGFKPGAAGSIPALPGTISGAFAFRLYDEQGFPLDLTELMARERGLAVDTAGFETLMEEQRARARAAQRRTVIELSEIEVKEPTNFVGFDKMMTAAKVLDVVTVKDRIAVILDATTCYAEMGGQVGDTGELVRGTDVWRITNTQKAGNTWLHFIATDGRTASGTERPNLPVPGSEVGVTVDGQRRAAIQRHHTVTHIMHWALHAVVNKEATQKGSFVGPDKLTFDFNSAPLTPKQLGDVERLVNACIIDNDHVWWTDIPYADVRGRPEVMQFFGDKYGETVRLVQVSGYAGHFDGYSMELCGGTHVRNTGEIGLFRIVSESAIAAGVRRIEAIAGVPAYDFTAVESRRLHAVAEKLGAPFGEIERKLDAFLTHEKELEKALKAAQQREAAGRAKELLGKVEAINGTPAIVADLGALDGDALQTVADALKSNGFKGVTVLGGVVNGAVSLVAMVAPDFTARMQAGKIIQTIAPIVGGKGGGKPDNARGGGKDASKLDEALAQARVFIGAGD